MKYLVLGSAGQIGQPLCEFLIERGHEVLTYDIATNINEDLRLEPEQKLRGLFDECDFVFFLAFDVGGSLYLKKYEKSTTFLSNNSKIMENTFALLDLYKKPFIFASSQMSNMLYSAYGVLKQLGEHYTSNLGGLTVKFWNVYGPESDPEKTHVITDFIKAAQTGDIKCKTSGKEVRQFLHVEDACEVLEILSKQYKDISRDEPLHITSFEWVSIKEVAHKIAGRMNVASIFSTEEDIVQMDAKNEPDINILKYWKPKISLPVGLERMIDYYVKS